VHVAGVAASGARWGPFLPPQAGRDRHHGHRSTIGSFQADLGDVGRGSNVVADDGFREPTAVWLRPTTSVGRDAGTSTTGSQKKAAAPGTPSSKAPRSRVPTSKAPTSKAPTSKAPPDTPAAAKPAAVKPTPTPPGDGERAGRVALWVAAVVVAVGLVIVAAVTWANRPAPETESAPRPTVTTEPWRTAPVGTCISMLHGSDGEWPLSVTNASIVECGTPGVTHQSVAPVADAPEDAGCDGVAYASQLEWRGDSALCLSRVYAVGQCVPVSLPDTDGKRHYWLGQVIPCEAVPVVGEDGMTYSTGRITTIGLDYPLNGCADGEARFADSPTTSLCVLPPG
jgi:hypothetical protein